MSLLVASWLRVPSWRLWSLYRWYAYGVDLVCDRLRTFSCTDNCPSRCVDHKEEVVEKTFVIVVEVLRELHMLAGICLLFVMPLWALLVEGRRVFEVRDMGPAVFQSRPHLGTRSLASSGLTVPLSHHLPRMRCVAHVVVVVAVAVV